MTTTILAISSQVAYGPVGNSATVPALESLGHTVLQVPSVVLSYHPGHGVPAGFKTAARDLEAIFAALDAQGMLAPCAGVFTGYFATPEQVVCTASIIRKLKAARPDIFYLCDPVMGDDPGGLYVPIDVAEAILRELLPLADCIAPNRFELFWLSGDRVNDVADAVRAAKDIKAREVLATSIPDEGGLATLAIRDGKAARQHSVRLANVPHGTGDLLSGLYLGQRLLAAGPEDALARAMERLARVIAASAGANVLDLRKGLA